MKKTALVTIIIFIIVSSCKIIDSQTGCAEFYVKNELSSNVLLRNYKLIDSGFYFSLDSFVIAPNETIKVNEDCRIGSVDPFPKGAYTRFFFANNKSKIDTFSRSSSFFDNDSINIYNSKLWVVTSENNGLLKKATYTITVNDSLEAR